jgi:murein DD-endopeptidase MepM/ murein hydrolase activator NlpD
VVGLVLGLGVVAALPALAQSLPLGGESTTTAPPDTSPPTTAPNLLDQLFTTTTAPPPPSTTAPAPGAGTGSGGEPAPGAEPGSPSTTLPPAPNPNEGEGGGEPVLGVAVPPDAQAVIDGIVRTEAADNAALVEGAAQLEAAGVPHEQAVRAVFGRFPVHGASRWSDDWYFPRWTGSTFRHHQGLDMFAAYGTPVAAPVDGIARVGSNTLGGLTVQVHEPDGTYWYLAHLSGIAPGLVDGQAVTAGQVVGFVGDSGNARGGAPHLHFGVYPQGGPAAPPKPAVDAWVLEGAARVPQLLASIGFSTANTSTPVLAASGRLSRVGTGRLGLGLGELIGPSQGELLWASAANPAGGAVQVADAAAAAAAGRVDWAQRAAEQRALDLAWDQAVARAQRVLAPLVDTVLRQTVEDLRD